MKRTIWIAVLSIGMLAAASDDARAHHIDVTGWALSGTDKVQVAHKKPTKRKVTDAVFAVNPSSEFELTLPFMPIGGTYVDKGRHGVTGTVDQAALNAYTAVLSTTVMTSTGATAVEVKSLKVSFGGSVSRSGKKLTLHLKTVLTTTATIGGKAKSVTVTETGTYSGRMAS